MDGGRVCASCAGSYRAHAYTNFLRTLMYGAKGEEIYAKYPLSFLRCRTRQEAWPGDVIWDIKFGLVTSKMCSKLLDRVPSRSMHGNVLLPRDTNA